MSVEYRWEVADEEWQAPPPLKRQRFPWRLVGALALLLAIGVAIAAVRFVRQVQQGEAHLERELATAISLEVQALRERDWDLFLSLQDRSDAVWYNFQKQQREQLATWPGTAYLEPGQEGNLTVVDAAFIPVEERAWAEVAWALDDGIYRRVQFYHLVEGQWLRTGAQPEYYGRALIRQTRHFTLKYPARDEQTADWLAEELEAWYKAICTDLTCRGGPRINVLVAADDKAGRDYQPPVGLALRSPRLRGVRDDGAPLLQDRRELAWMLAFLLVTRETGQVAAEPPQLSSQVMGSSQNVWLSFVGSGGIAMQSVRLLPVNAGGMGIVRSFSDDSQTWQQSYLLVEFINWQVRRLGLAGQDSPPTPLLDRVMASRGLEGIQALLLAMTQTSTEDEALRQAIGVGLEDMPDVFDQYLTAILAAERQLMEWQLPKLVQPAPGSAVQQIFAALLSPDKVGWQTQKESAFRQWRNDPGVYVYDLAIPLRGPSLNRWDWLDGVTIWAEVAYADMQPELPFTVTPRRIEFFRLVDGAWRHAPPDERFLGDDLVVQSAHFRVEGHEREAEIVARGLVRLEALYQRLTDALQTELLPGQRLIIRLSPSTTSVRLDPDLTAFRVPSPYFGAWWYGWDENYLVGWVSFPLFEKLALEAAGVPGSWPSHVNYARWSQAILNAWWMQVSGIEHAWGYWFYEMEPLASAARSGKLLTLDELGQIGFDFRTTTTLSKEKGELFYQQAAVVMGYVAETYGTEALPRLLRALVEADSLDEWLRLVLNVDQATFEAEWLVWLGEKIGQ